MPTIKSNEFLVAVGQILDDYAVDVQMAVAGAVKKTGEKAKKTVKAKSPVRKGKDGGRYKKGWKTDESRSGMFYTQSRVIIHNKDEYRLAHLLENGHVIRNGYQSTKGGRVEGIPHIKPAYEEAERTLQELTARAIEEAGTR